MPYRASCIDPDLDRRLRFSRPDEQLQVVVLVAAPDGVAPVEPAARRKLRGEIAAQLKEAAANLMPAIDAITRVHGGARLSESPTALGTLAVETTPAGVRALAELPTIAAVLANQELEPTDLVGTIQR